jgi:curved DNA-binding protein CbpA
MSAPVAGKFQDHYQVLGVEPNANSETIHAAYSRLASKYHPRNTETANKEKYDAVTLAYEVLSDPATRKIFDSVRQGPEKEAPPQFDGVEFFHELAKERLRRQCLLCLLYDRRKRKPTIPGLSLRQVESMMEITPDELLFSSWYLKQTGLIASDDKSNLMITVRGMDYLEENQPEAQSILALLRAVDKKAPA